MSKIRTFRRSLTVLAGICALISPLQAQQTDIVFERIRVPGGTNENRVHGIVQDHQGFMWLVTTGGLFKYDGYTFTKYGHDFFRANRTQGYESIWDVRVDGSGYLWVGTSLHGLHRLDPRTDEITSYRNDSENPNSLGSNNVYVTVEDRNGIVWIGTERGLNRFDPSTNLFTSFLHDPNDPTSLSSDMVWSLYEDKVGTLWVGTRTFEGRLGGLNRFEPVTDTFTRFFADEEDDPTLSGSDVFAILEDSHNRLWVGTRGVGLHTLDREHGTFTHYPYDPLRPNRLGRPYVSGVAEAQFNRTTVNNFHEDQLGILWIGAHTGGINLYDPNGNRMTHYESRPSDPYSLTNNYVFGVGESQDGVVWVGTLSRGGPGLHKAFRSSPFQFYSTGSSYGQVRDVIESEDGTFWVVAGKAGLRNFDHETGELTQHVVDLDIPNGMGTDISAIHESKDGALWIGRHSGLLTRFERVNEKFDHYFEDPSDSERGIPWITAIQQDMEGLLWLGSVEDGLRILDPNSGAFLRYRNNPDDPRSLSDNEIAARGIHESSDGSIWIRTGNGLNHFDRKTRSFDHFFTGLEGRGQTNDMVEDSDGQFWIAWADGDLTHFDPETGAVEHINATRAGLPGTTIASMILDDRGNLWVMTEDALARFDTDDRRFYSYPTSQEWTAFGGPRSGAEKTGDGELLFGGLNGVLAFQPDQMLATENKVPPKVALTGFNVSDEKVEPGQDPSLKQIISLADEIRLNHQQNEFSFDFVGLHYLNPEENRHAYMLEGYDDDWREAESERTASYYKVPPGTYTFRVKAANPFGVWSEEEATIGLVVLPPWWQSWWAYAVYVMSLGLVLFLGHWTRVRRLEKQTSRLTKMVAERTEDLNAEQVRTEAQARRLVELGEVKDRFFLNISHEFRTPLTLILGPLEDELSGIHGDVATGQRQRLMTMQRAGRRLHRLISQLLDLSKLEVGRMLLQARERDLVSFVKFIVLSFAPLAERQKIALKFRAESEKLALFFDVDKLEHVITNLLSNAFKFTREHEKILVSVVEVTEDGKPYAKISVKDTGSGIPASELPFIFDRFHQADVSRTRVGEGTGIGLSLAKEMVELHHGEIEVESEEGFGSTLTIRLPIGSEHLTAGEFADEPDEPDEPDEATGEHRHHVEPTWLAEIQTQETKTPETSSSSTGTATLDARPMVLVVEDNDDVREYLKGHLDELYSVIEAVDGVEGLEMARQNGPDLVLTDVMMPKMDGFELCRAIKGDEAICHIPVVILTARASEEAELEGLGAGADDYICKPFGAESLMTRVENLIEIRNLLRNRFAGEVSINATEVTVDSAEAVFLEQVRTTTEAHLGDSNFTVEWLADEVGVSTRQLRRKLRDLLNLSPNGYIRMIRLQRAAQLLEQRAGNVSEVAYQVGFNNPRYFSRLFRQTFGVSPSSYPLEQP